MELHLTEDMDLDWSVSSPGSVDNIPFAPVVCTLASWTVASPKLDEVVWFFFAWTLHLDFDELMISSLLPELIQTNAYFHFLLPQEASRLEHSWILTSPWFPDYGRSRVTSVHRLRTISFGHVSGDSETSYFRDFRLEPLSRSDLYFVSTILDQKFTHSIVWCSFAWMGFSCSPRSWRAMVNMVETELTPTGSWNGEDGQVIPRAVS